MLITLRFKKSLIVEQFQGNYLKQQPPPPPPQFYCFKPPPPPPPPPQFFKKPFTFVSSSVCNYVSGGKEQPWFSSTVRALSYSSVRIPISPHLDFDEYSSDMKQMVHWDDEENEESEMGPMRKQSKQTFLTTSRATMRNRE